MDSSAGGSPPAEAAPWRGGGTMVDMPVAKPASGKAA